MGGLGFAEAGFILAFAGAGALLFSGPLARLDAWLPHPLSAMTDERRSLTMVEATSLCCLVLGGLFILASR